MPLSDITDANAIRTAIAEFDDLGRDSFLQKYRFGRAREYFLRTDQGKLYDGSVRTRADSKSSLLSLRCS